MLQSIRVKIVSVLSYFCHSYYHHLDGIFSCFSIRPSSLCRFFSSCNFYRTLRPCVELTDVTLADEDTKSIPTDNVNRAIQGNVTMQVIQPSGQVWKQCKWRHLMTKFWTNPSCAVWWPNMQLIQVVPSGGQICN